MDTRRVSIQIRQYGQVGNPRVSKIETRGTQGTSRRLD